MLNPNALWATLKGLPAFPRTRLLAVPIPAVFPLTFWSLSEALSLT